MDIKAQEKLLNVGREFYNLGAPENPRCEEYTSALTIFNDLVSEGFMLEEVYNLRWHIYYLRKEFDNALNDLDSAIEIDSENRMAFYNRGCVFEYLEQRNKALDDFQVAKSLSKKVDDEHLLDAIEHHMISY